MITIPFALLVLQKQSPGLASVNTKWDELYCLPKLLSYVEEIVVLASCVVVFVGLIDWAGWLFKERLIAAGG